MVALRPSSLYIFTVGRKVDTRLNGVTIVLRLMNILAGLSGEKSLGTGNPLQRTNRNLIEEHEIRRAEKDRTTRAEVPPQSTK